jgi:hypothetical protein
MRGAVMSKLSDAELSLKVAKIMWPECEWRPWESKGCAVTGYDIPLRRFKHITDDALGKMCVWLANHLDSNLFEVSEDDTIIQFALLNKNPHRAIAEAIVEAGND